MLQALIAKKNLAKQSSIEKLHTISKNLPKIVCNKEFCRIEMLNMSVAGVILPPVLNKIGKHIS